MKISDSFIMDCILEAVENAVGYGIRRAYKHTDDKPPSEAQEEIIKESVTNALYGILEYENKDNN